MDEKKHLKNFGQNHIIRPIAIEAYASDASIYRIDPQAVACPKSVEDALKAIKSALNRKMSVTPRGGGTGLAGGALGSGQIVDFSGLNNVLSVDAAAKTVRCQPGIIYKNLNLYLKEHNLFFPPDPSSGDSCQIGGMLANNSSGPRSVKYGLTSHYVERLTIVQKDGQLLELSKLKIDSDEFHTFLKTHPEYQTVFNILNDNREDIQKNWPRVRKNSAGYNLKQVTDDFDNGLFNLPALYIGSEGTLGVFIDVTLRLLPIPGTPLSYRLFFGSLEAAGAAIQPLLATKPCALEIVDGSTLDLIGREPYAVPENAEAMLLLEYDENYDFSKQELKKLESKINLLRPPELAEDSAQRSSLWAARRAIVPILYRHHPTKRPFGFIEDASVPVDKLTEFIEWIRKRFETDNLVFGLFGHIGDGNLHIRPLLDMHCGSDYELTNKLYDEVYSHIVEIGGSSTAEHADGRLRAQVLRDVYKDDIYSIFKTVKKTLDPNNLFNPDVIISDKPFTDDIDYHKLELTCAACGKCNGFCPAYEIFRTEDMSPRGWLRMLHSTIEDDQSLTQAFQFCLNCKNCTTLCPAGVDIAGEILEFKAKYPHPTAGKVISAFNSKSLFGSALKIGSLSNPIMKSSIGKTLLSVMGGRSFGIDNTVDVPLPAFRSLRHRHKDNCKITTGVAFFHGCADNYFVSATGDAILAVYKHFGVDIAIPQQDCCGLPMEVYGHKDELITKAKHNIDSLLDYDAVIFSCASCLHRLADYDELFLTSDPYYEKSQQLKEKLFDASQYLLKQGIEFSSMKAPTPLNVSYHHPCHLRAAKLEQEPLKILEQIQGINLIHPELAGRCCGQAGSFGFTHFQEGTAIFDRKREEYIKLNPDVVVSSCPSCIAKVKKELPQTIKICHPLQIVDNILKNRDPRA